MRIQKRRKLSGWITWAIVAGVMLFLIPFYYFGRMDLALPSLFGATAIGCAIATRWKLRNRRWFWIAMGLVTALHIYFILRLEWHPTVIHEYVVATITLFDYGLILVFIWLVEIVCRTPEEAEIRRRKSLP